MYELHWVVPQLRGILKVSQKQFESKKGYVPSIVARVYV